MTLSELIKQLEQLKEKHGDIKAMIQERDEEGFCVGYKDPNPTEIEVKWIMFGREMLGDIDKVVLL